MGIRETRRVVGDYELTLQDYVKRRKFSDEISHNSYFIDVHFAAQTAKELFAWEEKGTLRYSRGETHGVPYRCLTPKNLKNVLVAGRSISCEQMVQGSIRVMPVCLTTGEAAGIAASHAITNGDNNVHAVNTDLLRQRLIEFGAYLPDPVASQ
jgi:hypothetical protein